MGPETHCCAPSCAPGERYLIVLTSLVTDHGLDRAIANLLGSIPIWPNSSHRSTFCPYFPISHHIWDDLSVTLPYIDK